MLLAALALFVSACGGSTAAESTTADAAPAESSQSDNAAAPALAVPGLTGEFATISGSQIDLGALQGQDVVLWFWAPW